MNKKQIKNEILGIMKDLKSIKKPDASMPITMKGVNGIIDIFISILYDITQKL